MKKIMMLSLVCMCATTAFTQKRINHVKTPEEKLNDEYCTGLFKMEDGTIFDLASDNNNVTGYFNILNWLEGRVAGLQVFTIRNGNRIPFIRNEQADIYVDEVPVSPGFLNSLSVSDIAMIKVIKSSFMGGFNGSGSAIAIYTFKAETEEVGEE